VTIRRLLIAMLLAQIGCIGVGLSFYCLYVSSALLRLEHAEARAELANQLRSLEQKFAQQDLSSIRQDDEFWESLCTIWRKNAEPTDQLYLLDREGRVLADGGKHTTDSPATSMGEPLMLSHPSANWGHFGEPIHGLLKDVRNDDRFALAQGLVSRDGYLMLTRVSNHAKVSPADLQGVLWLASGITFVWTCVLQAATLILILSYFAQRQSRDQPHSEAASLKQARALLRTQESVIFGLAKLSDSRDADTGSHLDRIAHYSSALAAGLRQRPEFRDQITPAFVQLIAISSALHDIGKVGLEDSILLKPGPLTREERTRMQEHTRIGEDCLKEIERRLGSSNFLQMAREISSAHHERWDGQGYPSGLAGEQIPLSGRIVALADVYDALSCKRVYKEALPHEQCVAMIAEAAGTHFDPRVVEVFLEIQDRFQQIWRQFHPETQPSEEPCQAAENRNLAVAASAQIDEIAGLLRQAGR
jgi:HD-GYP domain-containing protein (c-di-GMP phosphodiesterase class II)